MPEINPFLRMRSVPLPDEFPGANAMDELEIEAVIRVCRSKSLYRYGGSRPQREVDSFEEEFGRFLDRKHVLGVTSGTAALHTALMALGLGPGMEVIVPAYMWVSVVAAVVTLGAIPVLADIDESFCMNPENVEQHITDRTAGMIVVHMNGAAANIGLLAEIARRRGLFLLEDCAQAVGASFHGKKVGTFGDAAIFSFQSNKNMSSGEGGAVVTNNTQFYRRAAAIHDSGYTRGEGGVLLTDRPDICTWGRGERLDELRAAILRVQLQKLPDTIEKMRGSKRRIIARLTNQPLIRLRQVPDPLGDTGCFLLTIFPDSSIARAVNGAMRLMGICTASMENSNVILEDYGLHIYSNIPALVQKTAMNTIGSPWSLPENTASNYEYGKGTCRVADDLFSRTQLLTVPSCLTTADEDDIVNGFKAALHSLV